MEIIKINCNKKEIDILEKLYINKFKIKYKLMNHQVVFEDDLVRL